MSAEINALMNLLENAKSKKDADKILKRVREVAAKEANQSTSYSFD